MTMVVPLSFSSRLALKTLNETPKGFTVVIRLYRSFPAGNMYSHAPPTKLLSSSITSEKYLTCFSSTVSIKAFTGEKLPSYGITPSFRAIQKSVTEECPGSVFRLHYYRGFYLVKQVKLPVILHISNRRRVDII